MAKAYVLTNATMGEETLTRDAIAKIEGVTKSESVYGVYDIVVTVEHEDMETLKQIIANKIRRADGVRSTLTLVVSP